MTGFKTFILDHAFMKQFFRGQRETCHFIPKNGDKVFPPTKAIVIADKGAEIILAGDMHTMRVRYYSSETIERQFLLTHNKTLS
jgi:hypothetical protein